MGVPQLAFGTLGSPAFAYPAAPGFPPQYASKIENLWSNQNGDNTVVTIQNGDTLIAFVIGLKSIDPFDQLHGESPSFGFLQGLNDFNALPTVTDNSIGASTATVTAVAISSTTYPLTAAANASAGTTVYTGSGFGATNSLVGLYFVVNGFQNAGSPPNGENNGTYICTANTGTTLTLANANGVVETKATATATDYVLTVTASNSFSSGQIVQLSGLAEPWLNGLQFTVATASGSAFTANYAAYDGPYTNASEPAGALASGSGGNVWVLLTELSLADADYNVTSVPPANGPAGVYAQTFVNGKWVLNSSAVQQPAYPSATWNIDGYYPCVYVFVCYGANLPAAVSSPFITSYVPPLKVTVNSCYQNGIDPPQDLAAGKPIFDGGVDIIVVPFTDMTAVSADGESTNISDPSSTVGSNNPAQGIPITTTGTGDLVIALALQKSANGLGLGADATLHGGSAAGSPPVASGGYGMVANGKLVGSEAHYLIEWGVQTTAGSWTPSFANPIGYDTIIAAIALKHS